jgi:hypothetical protein
MPLSWRLEHEHNKIYAKHSLFSFTIVYRSGCVRDRSVYPSPDLGFSRFLQTTAEEHSKRHRSVGAGSNRGNARRRSAILGVHRIFLAEIRREWMKDCARALAALTMTKIRLIFSLAARRGRAISAALMRDFLSQRSLSRLLPVRRGHRRVGAKSARRLDD